MSAPVENLVERLHAKRSGKGWIAKCPAHDDRKPSLSIDEGSDGRALIRCHAGCDNTAILASLGMKPRDLFPVTLRRQSDNGSTPIQTYNYTDENGRVIFQVCRFYPKKFKQRRPDGRGGWIWNTNGVTRPLYRLPQVVAAQTLAITEGEKDADALGKLGIVATTNSGGAGRWRDEYSDTLRGKDVVIFGDDDVPGGAHVDQIIESLTGVANDQASDVAGQFS